jgi:hypothetical protein
VHSRDPLFIPEFWSCCIRFDVTAFHSTHCPLVVLTGRSLVGIPSSATVGLLFMGVPYFIPQHSRSLQSNFFNTFSHFHEGGRRPV